jgi:uncharacterized protein (DUF2235 family)
MAAHEPKPLTSFAFPEPPPMQRRDARTSLAVPYLQGRKAKRKFILCFDGTGNKFSGTDADSNILKIYRMLDRNEDDQFHYYQPGIGMLKILLWFY